MRESHLTTTLIMNHKKYLRVKVEALALLSLEPFRKGFKY